LPDFKTSIEVIIGAAVEFRLGDTTAEGTDDGSDEGAYDGASDGPKKGTALGWYVGS
jgi:hypothetical protein